MLGRVEEGIANVRGGRDPLTPLPILRAVGSAGAPFQCINVNSQPDCMKAPADPYRAAQSRRPL
jgi:hypothetical protein